MSEIRATTISDAAGTGPIALTGQYAPKAWVNFNGIGTIAIRDSENVSSVTDNGLGDYTTNFTTALTDANYVAAGMEFETGSTGNNDKFVGIKRATNYSDSITTSSCRHHIGPTAGDRSCLIMYLR